MTDYYYSNQPVAMHDIQQIDVELRGIHLQLYTDTSVFSKKRIDPGTKLLIEALPLTTDLHHVLDLGCGYGPIGLTIAGLLPEATIYMSDVNERAVELAGKNAVLNGINNVIIKAGEGFSSFPDQLFDLVVTNPPVRAGKQIIYPLIEGAGVALRPGGWLAAVMLTRQGVKSLERKMIEVFENVVELEKRSGYRVVASQR